MASKRAQRAYDLAKNYEKNYKGCAQCTVAGLQDALGDRKDDVLEAATSLGGGCMRTAEGSCGAYVGCLMVLGTLYGRKRDELNNRQKVLDNADIALKLRRKFIEEYGSVICSDIQNRIFGRYFYMADPEEFQKFEAAGGHGDKGAPEVVGKAARWMVEILEEAKLIPEK
jgi:C_GCAxxG_C_C family probable redox protein